MEMLTGTCIRKCFQNTKGDLRQTYVRLLKQCIKRREVSVHMNSNKGSSSAAWYPSKDPPKDPSKDPSKGPKDPSKDPPKDPSKDPGV